jgi:hypothetical protein
VNWTTAATQFYSVKFLQISLTSNNIFDSEQDSRSDGLVDRISDSIEYLQYRPILSACWMGQNMLLSPIS